MNPERVTVAAKGCGSLTFQGPLGHERIFTGGLTPTHILTPKNPHLKSA